MRKRETDVLGNWKTQLRKGFLELFILNHLRSGEYYGYDLVQAMKRIDGLAMREGTIYPILARLQDDGLVRSEIRSSDSGPPRKYFQITETGREALRDMNRHWQSLETAMRTAAAGTKETEE